jgi:hypothetical protein
MARPHDRRQQLKKQKAKTKREQVRRKNAAQALPTSLKALIARAVTAPFGPCWVSTSLGGELDEEIPPLITVIVSRRVGGLLLPCITMVDRTCLGIKNAFTGALQTEFDLERLVEDLGARGGPLAPAELLLAQSIVFHALDYAGSLGFEPNRDFVVGLIGERPAVLLETPLCRPERPVFVAGPYDDVDGITARLAARVGPNGYDLINDLDEPGDDEDDWDLEDEIFDDEDVITVEGIEQAPGTPDSPR